MTHIIKDGATASSCGGSNLLFLTVKNAPTNEHGWDVYSSRLSNVFYKVNLDLNLILCCTCTFSPSILGHGDARQKAGLGAPNNLAQFRPATVNRGKNWSETNCSCTYVQFIQCLFTHFWFGIFRVTKFQTFGATTTTVTHRMAAYLWGFVLIPHFFSYQMSFESL